MSNLLRNAAQNGLGIKRVERSNEFLAVWRPASEPFALFSNFGVAGFTRACIALLSLAAVALGQQTAEKEIVANDVVPITAPIIITNITVAGKPVECGLFVKPNVTQPITPFQSGPDWLQQTTISLFNRTNKTIVFASMNVFFLDTGDCQIVPCAIYGIRLGHLPSVDSYSARTGQPLKPDHPERPALEWKTKTTVTVRLGDYLDEIEQTLSGRISVTAVSKIAIHPADFYFEDGMRWNGWYSVPDPERHGKFKYLPDNYFPGRRSEDWPPGYNR